MHPMVIGRRVEPLHGISGGVRAEHERHRIEVDPQQRDRAQRLDRPRRPRRSAARAAPPRPDRRSCSSRPSRRAVALRLSPDNNCRDACGRFGDSVRCAAKRSSRAWRATLQSVVHSSAANGSNRRSISGQHASSIATRDIASATQWTDAASSQSRDSPISGVAKARDRAVTDVAPVVRVREMHVLVSAAYARRCAATTSSPSTDDGQTRDRHR